MKLANNSPLYQQDNTAIRFIDHSIIQLLNYRSVYAKQSLVA